MRLTAVLGTVFALLLVIRLFVIRPEVNFWRYYGLDKTVQNNLIIGGLPVGKGAVSENGITYIDTDKVREYIDPDIYYNDEESRVIITTDSEVLRIDGESPDLNFPVFIDSGTAYLPVSLLESVYGVQSKVMNDGAVLSLDSGSAEGVVTKNTRLYAKPEKGGFFCKVQKDTSVLTYGEDGGYTLAKIMTDGETGGFVGYISSECIKTVSQNETKPENNAELWQPEGKIDLVFDQISNAAGASLTMSGGAPEGVNVLCPTWFSFKDTSGEIVNKANMDYVNWAHENGLKVWGLVTDNFDSSVSHAVLSDDNTRKYVIEQLSAYAQTYGLDGINVDFESVPGSDGKYWIQFLRELVPECHKNGLTVSVDLFVPKAWTAHYDRSSVGRVVDYAVVMGYDEHYRGSSEAGSVASYDWSVTAVKGSINAGIPAEKLILGIPFYTRVWTEKANGEPESDAYSMEAAEELLEQNDAVFSFDDKTGQTYAEYTDGEGRHRCWLEDGDSVRKRTELVNEYSLAGVAAWKLRMEKAGIFHIIDEVIAG